MLVGILRIKMVAILIGPVGVGLQGTYQATIRVIGNIAGLGIKSSAVRDVSEAISAGDQERVGKTVLTLRRISWLTGLVGFVSVLLLSGQLSQLTFGTRDHALSISIIGLTILFTNIQGGQGALIQGMRRISDLAKMNIIGSVVGSAISVTFYAWLGLRGIVPAIVSLAALQLAVSWWFARRIPVPQVSMSWQESLHAAGGMLKLGLSFMWSGLLVSMVAYATRTLLARELDLVAVGIYSAAYGLSGMVVNFILGAMGADYYPSLTAVADDNEKMRSLVNEQTEIGLLLATPGLLFTIALAPWIVRIFYSDQFTGSAVLLQWFVLGCLGRVISWPMGFVMLAKGKAKLFAWIQTYANVLHISLVYFLLLFFGIKGVAIAFAILYIIHTFVVLLVSKHLIGFIWSKNVLALFTITLTAVMITFLSTQFVSEFTAMITGVCIGLSMSFYCLHGLAARLGPDHIITKLAVRFPLISKRLHSNL